MASNAPDPVAEPEVIADAKAAVGPVAAEAEADAKAAEAEVVPEAKSVVEEIEAEVEKVAEEVVAEVEHLAQFIPMVHRDDGGISDSFEKDDAGNHLVPVDQVQTALDHGFVPAAS